MPKNLTIWLLATRPQFFTVVVFPILLGTVVAWHIHHIFSLLYLVLSLLAGILTHAGVNVLNDYFDHCNKTDDFNLKPLTPFAGGSRMIQNKLLTVEETYFFGLILLISAVALGLYLVWITGPALLWIGVIGILSGYFYSAPPFSLNSRGIGELLVGINFGTLTVLGAYYVQTGTIDLAPMIVSLPLTCLVTAILYINQFPDYYADKKAGKRNLVVRLGQVQARSIYAWLILSHYLIILLGWLFSYFPSISLLILLTIPLGGFAIKRLYVYYDQPLRLLPAIKVTILLHTTTSLLLIWSFYSHYDAST